MFGIEYAVCCHTGKVRGSNQDNFWCMGRFLESGNDGLTKPDGGTIQSLSLPAFAVFDGMGGEQRGEMAAYIAAAFFDLAYKENPKDDIKGFLLDACYRMNREICAYAKENKIRAMGATAAIILFGKSDIYICNLGDSRIYQFSGKDFAQISRDHSQVAVAGKKPQLTQCLGIPETEFVIAPYVSKGGYARGDKYLICSDGLTDMVSEEKIAAIIAEKNNVLKCGERLLQKALDSGGGDNITIILCEIRKQR